MHKSELAALDRKITADLAPKHDDNDGTEVKQEQSQQPKVKTETTVNTVNIHTTDTPQGHKPSMVAEQHPSYPMSANVPRFPALLSGI